MSNEDLRKALFSGSSSKLAEPKMGAIGPTNSADEDLEDVVRRFYKAPEPKKVKVSCYISQKLDARITEVAKKSNSSVSSVIERALEDFLGG